MKIFISADMEGISGITDKEDVSPGGRTYEHSRKLLTEDVNAAIEGALEAGATEILVNDSHGPMRNILVDELHPKAELIRGFYKPMLMMQGLDASFDAAFFIGYHGKAGLESAVLNHTVLTKCIQRFKLNGKEVGEAGLNAAVAAAYKVPVIFATGDSQTAEEIEGDIPGIFTVAVKKGLGTFTARSLHPKVAQGMIKDKARFAVENVAKVAPLKIKDNYTIEIEFKTTNMAAVVSYIPGVELLDGRTVRYESNDMIQAMPVVTAMFLLSLQAAHGL